ncbi:isoprenylcysteine carboxylmethyltransferase family protein [Halobacillus litoralis]|uniref:methyltransferase family protein n=1 Tax=Halobacillus litoralis TaxID=45668 RepID=UPI001CD5782D|nr:isoprenylcysteine carboxylmethyltransferase family protein [Halobacillus litoralis]MCA0972562.1 isoprenylcysteine carboxylmethyltransferase family protein [Halobacillus litoralis]
MSVLEIIFLLVTLLWLLEFFLFRNRESKGEDQLEKRSFPLILAAIIIAVSVSLTMREWGIGVVLSESLLWAGLILYASGVALRYWGILHLKDQFTRDVSVKRGDKLVSTGPYRFLRHPLYTGLVLIVIGFCLGVGNVWTALFCGALVTMALLHRIRIEEAMLIEAHGDLYRKWCASRYRLIPFIY